MTIGPRLGVTATICALLAGLGSARAADQQIGSWIVECTAPGDCVMRNAAWVLPPGGGRPSAALEVRRRDDAFVPVVTLRGLSTEQAVGGMLTMKASVAVSLDNERPVALDCSLASAAIVCAPLGDAATATAAELPGARTATVHIQLSIPGMMALPAEQRSMSLVSTREALARFSADGPPPEEAPIEPGLDWNGFVQLIFRELGFHNGVADLQNSTAALLRR